VLLLRGAPAAALAAVVGFGADAVPSARVGCRLGGGGECSSWRWRAAFQGEFFQGQVVLHLQEGGKGADASQQSTDVREALVEATKHVEDEGAISDNLSQGGEIVGHLLQTAAVLGDGEITLYEVAKLRLELDRPCLPIAQELGFDGEPGVPGSGALGGDDFGEGVENPGLGNAVHPIPVRRGGRGGEDVRLEGEFAEDQQELIAPAVEVVGVNVEDDVDEAPDVVDGDGLGVKVEEGGGLLEQQCRVKVSRASSRRGRLARRGLHGSGGL
jgi:hypothetical protein